MKYLLENKRIFTFPPLFFKRELLKDFFFSREKSRSGGANLFNQSSNQFHPVYFVSKKTTGAEGKYTSYELDALAVIEALKEFRVYVLGYPFKIVTDCNEFKMTMDKKEISRSIAR